MLERATGFEPSVVAGRFMVHVAGNKRPWIVIGQGHRTVTLDAGLNFFEWAHEQWPAPRWTVELDPWNSLGRLGGE